MSSLGEIYTTEMRMKETAKGWQDFWAEFFRIKHRRQIEGIRECDRKLVTHVVETLGLNSNVRILDLACGGGDQAIEFARGGMRVVGIDIAEVLVDQGNDAARRENLPVRIIQGDMREVSFKDEFDACVILSGSFGFFDDEGNLRVLQIMEQALKRRGRFYIHGANPLKKMRNAWKGWDEVEGGYVLMGSDYDPKTGRMIDAFFYITDAGELVRFMPTPEDKGFSLETRMYTLPEMIALIETANLRFLSAYGSIELPPEQYAPSSNSMIVVGEKP